MKTTSNKTRRRFAGVVIILSLAIMGCQKNSTDKTKLTGVAPLTDISQPEGFPKRNIEFFLPVPAGGLIDLSMRSLADAVDFGKPVIVINRPGLGQTMGLSEFYSKSHDPHLITAAGFSGFIIQPYMTDVPYSIDDFRYIAINHPPEPQIIVSSKYSKYQTWQDVKEAVAAGEEVRYSAPNPAGLGRIVIFEIMNQEQISFNFIPYTGSGEGISALLAGHIDFYIIDASVVVPYIQNKQLTALMISGSDRLTKLPEVPSTEELGIRNMERFVGYTAIAVSKETPDEIVKWLKLKIDEAQQSPLYKEYLNTVVGSEDSLKHYTEEEITQMVYSSYEAIIKEIPPNSPNF
jgi:tripartite-type tricarboxylate transporter receptor subunit TctC